MLDEVQLREFYEFVYPVELVTQWLSYNFAAVDKEADTNSNNNNNSNSEYDDGGNGAALSVFASDDIAKKDQRNVASEGYLSRREFCFTLLGDIFTRFRSYSTAAELRRELIRCYPEKIDVGAVYSIRPNQKQSASSILPLERELVFDIDMSDYDSVRSCCSGKSICPYCWTWMSCAAHVLRRVLEEDFGFRYILPVFSGRRGIHLWVCDRRACRMHDDERAALVGYLTVVAPKSSRQTVVADFVNGKPIHPTIRGVQRGVIDAAFTELFLESPPSNPNSVLHPKGAGVVYAALVSALKMGSRRDVEQRFVQNVPFAEGNVLDWRYVVRALGDAAASVTAAAQILIMYPRLDEHVTTRRDHLLKLPFCVHPGTASLCCPLEWDEIASFNPITDAPRLGEMLMHRHVDSKWILPLKRMLKEMSEDPAEER